MNLIEFVKTLNVTNVITAPNLHHTQVGIEFDVEDVGTIRLVIQREEFDGYNWYVTTSVKGVDNTLDGYRYKRINQISILNAIRETVEQYEWVTGE